MHPTEASKHTELIEKISAVNDDVLLIDTDISSLLGSCLEIRHDQSDDPRSAVDRRMVMAPTWQAVHDLVGEFGYEVAALKPDFDDYTGARDFRRRRRAFLCVRETNVSRVPAETESESPYVPDKPPGGKLGPRRGSATNANKLERWVCQTDLALTELLVSRRYKLARALDAIWQRVLRTSDGTSPEDRLLVASKELRALSENRRDGAPRRNSSTKTGNSKDPH